MVALVDGRENVVEVVDDAADDPVAVRERRGERRGVREQRLDRAALPLEHLDDLEGELVHLAR